MAHCAYRYSIGSLLFPIVCLLTYCSDAEQRTKPADANSDASAGAHATSGGTGGSAGSGGDSAGDNGQAGSSIASGGSAGDANATDVPFGIDSRVSNSTCHAPGRPVVVPTGEYDLAPLFPNLTTGSGVLGKDAPIMVRRVRMPSTNPDPANPGKLLPGPWVWFVALRSGRIFAMTDTAAANPPATNLRNAHTDRDMAIEEGGLLGLAFDPDIATDSQRAHVYIVTANWGEVSLKRLRVNTTADGGSYRYTSTDEVEILQAWGGSHHYGGETLFGPDGLLYMSVGEAEIFQNTQLATNLRGKVLRIDVHSKGLTEYYGIPQDNPWRGTASSPNARCFETTEALGNRSCPEVYAVGFRNPFRFSFDRQGGALWLGDVGASHEEINLVQRGKNYGWNTYEGHEPLNDAKYVPAIAEIPREGCQVDGYAIIGGFVYRGSALPSLQGKYIAGDNGAGKLYVVEGPYGAAPKVKTIYNGNCARSDFRPGSFAEDEHGELYVVSLNPSRGAGVFKIVGKTSEQPPTDGNPPARRLSETGCVEREHPTEPIAAAIPYDVNAPLWSDGLIKRRFMALPDGTKIQVDQQGDWHFPVGTVLMKEFSAPATGKRIETRLLVHHKDGDWAGYTYVWNGDNSDAELAESARSVSLGDGEASWTIPSRTDCLSCHSSAKDRVLGLETRQLNRAFVYPGSRRANQLATLNHLELLDPPITDATAQPAFHNPYADGPVEARARAYLHSNCSHCHPGPGTGHNLLFDTSFADMHLCNVRPGQTVPNGTALLVPGDPQHSVLAIRMRDLAAHRMPPLGTQRVDSAGVQLIEDWIRGISACPQ